MRYRIRPKNRTTATKTTEMFPLHLIYVYALQRTVHTFDNDALHFPLEPECKLELSFTFIIRLLPILVSSAHLLFIVWIESTFCRIFLIHTLCLPFHICVPPVSIRLVLMQLGNFLTLSSAFIMCVCVSRQAIQAISKCSDSNRWEYFIDAYFSRLL